jgi:hypothetical protein
MGIFSKLFGGKTLDEELVGFCDLCSSERINLSNVFTFTGKGVSP